MEIEKQTEKMLLKAGKIASEVREFSKKLVKPGINMLQVAEQLEKMIFDKGGKPAWPVNISVNEVAAHYTPVYNEKYVFTEKDIVKVDVGVHVDGHIADNATTICLNPDLKNISDAAEKALKEAIKIAVPGAKIAEIGSVIQQTIESYGLKPVSNLTGHGIGYYEIHTEPSIPNVKFGGNEELFENQLIAIEPFATDGAGMIKDSSTCTIFQFAEMKGTRMPNAKKVLELSYDKFETMPFASRWITEVKEPLLSMSINQLVQNGSVIKHPVLKEVRNGMVSQFEHTIIVKDKPIVTTL